MVTGAYHPEIAGGAVQCRTLIRHLADRVAFCVLSITNDPMLRSPDIVDGVPVFRVSVNLARPSSKLAAGLQLGWRLLSLRQKFDVLHLHGFSEKSLLLVAIARLLRKPILLKLTLLGEDDPASVRRRGFLFWRQYTAVDRFIATSPALERSLLDARLPPTRVERIPNGVDVNRFRPASADQRRAVREELRLPQDASVILFVGIMAPKKRPELLFEAWTALGSLAMRTTLLFVGATHSRYSEIDPGIAERIRAQACELGLTDRVRFVGETFAVEKYYQAADILVLPSSREGLPNALLEAMASGLPCIASLLPGITDGVIEDRTNGLLVPSGVRQPLVDALRMLLEQPQTARDMGRRARRTIEAHYGIEHTADRHFDVYTRLLSSSVLM